MSVQFNHAFFPEIGQNRIFLVTLMVWALAQTTKVLIGVYREKKFNFRWFIGTGGMPSSHAAGVTSMATAIGMEYGFNSGLFAIAATIALVTMFDAQGVRRSAGQQATILNKMMEDIWKGHLQERRLIELVGHTPVQVLAGFVFGILWTMYLY